MEIKKMPGKVWKFLKEDTWKSTIVWLILLIIFIKIILPLITGTALPLMIVESCSMYHSDGLESILKNPVYSQNGISLSDAERWNFKNGINKGDVVFAVGVKEPKMGDVIIYNARRSNPIIHRVIDTSPLTTKGDNNAGLLPFEKGIDGEQVIGRAVFRIPLVGWIKLIIFEPFRASSERGLC